MKRMIPRGTPSLATKVLRLLGVNLSSEESLKDPRDDPAHISNQPVTFNVQAYLLGKRRMHEIEGDKALVIAESRHDKWKAGGPC